MSDTGLASALFPSFESARKAKVRLVSGGFARNGIDIERRRGDFAVSIHVRDERRALAESLLNRSPVAHLLREKGGHAATALQDNRLIALGLAGLAGLPVFSLLHRR